MRKPVEHYVVKPNRTQGDWTYEYSDGSSINGCNCCKDTDKLSRSINDLQLTLQNLQGSIQDISSGNVDQEQLANIVAETVNRYMLGSNELKTIIDQEIIAKVDTSTNSADVATLKEQMQEVIDQLESIDSVIQNIQNIEELSQLDLEAISNYTITMDAVANDIEGIKQQLQGIDDAIDTAIANNSTISGLTGDIAQLNQRLTEHIGDNSKHLNNNDVHVTAEEKAYWNAIAGGGTTDVEFTVENKELKITKGAI